MRNHTRNYHTSIRTNKSFTLKIYNYENKTASLEKRIEACIKVIKAQYPTGFIIAPVFLYNNWKADYKNLFESEEELDEDDHPLPEFIHENDLFAQNQKIEKAAEKIINFDENNPFGNF